jgi:hypothetical protein
MLATMQSLAPEKAPSLDPMAAIASQLGLPEDQVCQAIFHGGSPVAMMIGKADGNGDAFFESKGPVGPDGGQALAPDGGQVLNLTTANVAQLAPIAAKLGVSPEKLQSAIKVAVAGATPAQLPKPPSQQQIVSTFARNLGMDESRVSSAITQVEGSNGFYFAVPVPGATH